VASVLQVDLAGPGESQAVAPGAGRDDAIKHVRPARNTLDEIAWRAHTHQIARLVAGQAAHGQLERVEHRLLRLPHRKAADGVALKLERHQAFRRLLAQAGVDATLDDAEQRLAGAGHSLVSLAAELGL